VTRKGMDFAGELARIALMGSDSPTRFKGRLGVKKRVAWAAPLPLEDVKVMGKALGCSINDVLLAMATGALREYLQARGDAVDGLGIRAIVPVNLRPQGRGHELGNQFGLVFLDLPIGIDDPWSACTRCAGTCRNSRGPTSRSSRSGSCTWSGTVPRSCRTRSRRFSRRTPRP